ncbi:MAG: hypothetical protein ACI4I1_02505 [Oscillospiraceae bacterium]
MKKLKEMKISRSFAVVYCVLLLIGFICGMSVVNVNCYNSMNAEPMILFEVGEDSIIIMNRSFRNPLIIAAEK